MPNPSSRKTEASTAIASILRSKPVADQYVPQFNDMIDPVDVENEYSIPRRTQAVWRSTNRYGFRDISYRLGGLIRYSRRELEAWIAERRGSEIAARKAGAA